MLLLLLLILLVDVFETVTIATSSTGAILRSEVNGKVRNNYNNNTITDHWYYTVLGALYRNTIVVAVVVVVAVAVVAVLTVAVVVAQVMMKTQLTGMPECKFGLNDKLIMEKEGGAAAAAANQKASGVEIDDCTFHR